MSIALDIDVVCAARDDELPRQFSRLGVLTVQRTGSTRWKVIDSGLVTGAAAFHPRGMMPIRDDAIVLFETTHVAQVSARLEEDALCDRPTLSRGAAVRCAGARA